MSGVFRPRAIVFDVDGTLADSAHRRHVVTDWLTVTEDKVDEWASLMHLDKPIAPMVELARTLWMTGFQIVLLTSRCAKQDARTRHWMKEHGIPFNALYTREVGERSSGADFKRRMVQTIQAKWEIEWAIDDDPQIVKMFREKGIMCLQVPHNVPPYGDSTNYTTNMAMIEEMLK